MSYPDRAERLVNMDEIKRDFFQAVSTAICVHHQEMHREMHREKPKLEKLHKNVLS